MQGLQKSPSQIAIGNIEAQIKDYLEKDVGTKAKSYHDYLISRGILRKRENVHYAFEMLAAIKRLRENQQSDELILTSLFHSFTELQKKSLRLGRTPWGGSTLHKRLAPLMPFEEIFSGVCVQNEARVVQALELLIGDQRFPEDERHEKACEIFKPFCKYACQDLAVLLQRLLELERFMAQPSFGEKGAAPSLFSVRQILLDDLAQRFGTATKSQDEATLAKISRFIVEHKQLWISRELAESVDFSEKVAYLDLLNREAERRRVRRLTPQAKQLDAIAKAAAFYVDHQAIPAYATEAQIRQHAKARGEAARAASSNADRACDMIDLAQAFSEGKLNYSSACAQIVAIYGELQNGSSVIGKVFWGGSQLHRALTPLVTSAEFRLLEYVTDPACRQAHLDGVLQAVSNHNELRVTEALDFLPDDVDFTDLLTQNPPVLPDLLGNLLNLNEYDFKVAPKLAALDRALRAQLEQRVMAAKGQLAAPAARKKTVRFAKELEKPRSKLPRVKNSLPILKKDQHRKAITDLKTVLEFMLKHKVNWLPRELVAGMKYEQLDELKAQYLDVFGRESKDHIKQICDAVRAYRTQDLHFASNDNETRQYRGRKNANYSWEILNTEKKFLQGEVTYHVALASIQSSFEQLDPGRFRSSKLQQRLEPVLAEPAEGVFVRLTNAIVEKKTLEVEQIFSAMVNTMLSHLDPKENGADALVPALYSHFSALRSCHSDLLMRLWVDSRALLKHLEKLGEGAESYRFASSLGAMETVLCEELSVRFNSALSDPGQLDEAKKLLNFMTAAKVDWLSADVLAPIRQPEVQAYLAMLEREKQLKLMSQLLAAIQSKNSQTRISTAAEELKALLPAGITLRQIMDLFNDCSFSSKERYWLSQNPAVLAEIKRLLLSPMSLVEIASMDELTCELPLLAAAYFEVLAREKSGALSIVNLGGRMIDNVEKAYPEQFGLVVNKAKALLWKAKNLEEFVSTYGVVIENLAQAFFDYAAKNGKSVKAADVIIWAHELAYSFASYHPIIQDQAHPLHSQLGPQYFNQLGAMIKQQVEAENCDASRAVQICREHWQSKQTQEALIQRFEWVTFYQTLVPILSKIDPTISVVAAGNPVQDLIKLRAAIIQYCEKNKEDFGADTTAFTLYSALEQRFVFDFDYSNLEDRNQIVELVNAAQAVSLLSSAADFAQAYLTTGKLVPLTEEEQSALQTQDRALANIRKDFSAYSPNKLLLKANSAPVSALNIRPASNSLPYAFALGLSRVYHSKSQKEQVSLVRGFAIVLATNTGKAWTAYRPDADSLLQGTVDDIAHALSDYFSRKKCEADFAQLQQLFVKNGLPEAQELDSDIAFDPAKLNFAEMLIEGRKLFGFVESADVVLIHKKDDEETPQAAPVLVAGNPSTVFGDPRRLLSPLSAAAADLSDGNSPRREDIASPVPV